MTPHDRDEIREEFRQYFLWAVSGLIDTLYLIIWVVLQWISNRIISGFDLSGQDVAVFAIFQVLFGLSTLAPTAIYIYTDVRTMWIKSKVEIEKARIQENKVSTGEFATKLRREIEQQLNDLSN